MTWERINNYNDSRDTAYAKTALAWVTRGAHPLSPRQLQHALAATLTEECDINEGLVPHEDISGLCVGLLSWSAATLGNVTFSHSSAKEYFESRRKIYFPNAHDDITTACVGYLRLWLKGLPQNSILPHTLNPVDRPPPPTDDGLATEIYMNSLKYRLSTHISDGSWHENRTAEWPYDPRHQGSAPTLRLGAHNDSPLPLRRKFQIDCSGLGQGRQLVLLDYAYENVWFHARRATSAQKHVLDLIIQHPVLYEIRNTGEWKQLPQTRWLDTASEFWYAALAMYYGLTNHAKFMDCVASPKAHTIDPSLDSPTERLEALAYRTSFESMSLKFRIYFLFALGVYFQHGRDTRNLDIIGLLGRVRMSICNSQSDSIGARYSSSSLSSDHLTRGDTRSYAEEATQSGAHGLWNAYISRNFDYLKPLVKYGADISALRDHPILGLPNMRIETTQEGARIVQVLKFTAYGPDKSWFKGLKYVSGTPECIDGILQARMEIKLDAYPSVGLS